MERGGMRLHIALTCGAAGFYQKKFRRPVAKMPAQVQIIGLTAMAGWIWIAHRNCD
jgi:hypothetical protein